MELNINFLPKDYKPKILKFKAIKAFNLVLLLIIIYLLVSTSCFFLINKRFLSILVDLENYLEENKEVCFKIERTQQLKKTVLENKGLDKNIYSNKFSWTDYLVDLEKNTPEGIEIGTISGYASGKINLLGQAQNFAEVIVFMENLSGCERFDSINVQYIETKDKLGEKQFNFMLVCKLKGSMEL